MCILWSNESPKTTTFSESNNGFQLIQLTCLPASMILLEGLKRRSTRTIFHQSTKLSLVRTDIDSACNLACPVALHVV